MRSLLPGAAYGLVRAIEGCLRPFASRLGMFALIVLTQSDPEKPPPQQSAPEA